MILIIRVRTKALILRDLRGQRLVWAVCVDIGFDNIWCAGHICASCGGGADCVLVGREVRPILGVSFGSSGDARRPDTMA